MCDFRPIRRVCGTPGRVHWGLHPRPPAVPFSHLYVIGPLYDEGRGLCRFFFKKEIEKKICPCQFSQFTPLCTQSVAGGSPEFNSSMWWHKYECRHKGKNNPCIEGLFQPSCIPRLCWLRATVRLYSPSWTFQSAALPRSVPAVPFPFTPSKPSLEQVPAPSCRDRRPG